VRGALAAAALSLAACTAPEARPDLLLVTIDTLRADHLESYGYARHTAPGLAALAQRGVLFRRAIAQCNWTLPSLASIHTGLYPSQHGAVSANFALGDEYVTLGEALHAAGYHTLAVVSHSFADRQHGFAQGFDEFDESQILPEDAVTSEAITHIALERIARAPRPTFAWVHYFDPHYTYVPHPEFGFAGPPPPRLASGPLAMRRLNRIKGESGLRPDETQYLEDVYDEEIAYTDRAIGELVAGIADRPTLIVVAADHGELFGERDGYLGHGKYVVQPLVQVPLIFSGRIDPALRGRVVERPVELASLPATLARAAGLAEVPFRGEDLIEVARRGERSGIAFTENGWAWGRIRLRSAAVSERWKLVRDADAGRFELYDLASDPDERHDRWGEASAEVRAARRRLAPALREFGQRDHHPRAPEIQLRADQLERLKALGYAR
jgi:arylsulfatase A-like enzyme